MRRVRRRPFRAFTKPCHHKGARCVIDYGLTFAFTEKRVCCEACGAVLYTINLLVALYRDKFQAAVRDAQAILEGGKVWSGNERKRRRAKYAVIRGAMVEL